MGKPLALVLEYSLTWSACEFAPCVRAESDGMRNYSFWAPVSQIEGYPMNLVEQTAQLFMSPPTPRRRFRAQNGVVIRNRVKALL